MTDLFEFKTPLDLLSVMAGGAVGFALVYLVDLVWRPKVNVLGFSKIKVNFGTLYKLRFKLSGRSSPGLCCFNIEWCGKNVFAKWDELPNPLEGDDVNQFRPELVPATFYQPLFQKSEYNVPIIIENDGKYEIFSGWWFGKNSGYGPNPELEKKVKIRLTLQGASLRWSKEYNVNDIIERGR